MPYIFLSAHNDDLDFARRVHSQLEWAGYSAWIDERTEFVVPTDAQQVLDAVIRVAGAVVAIEGGDPDDIEAAIRFGKPIFYLTRRDDPLSLLPELVSLMPDEVSPAQVLLPQPLDAAEIRALQAEFDQTRRTPTLVLVIGVVILAAIAVFVIAQIIIGLSAT